MAGVEQLETRQVLSGMAGTPVYNGQPAGNINPVGAPPFPFNQTFRLHSFPGGQKTIFLDFDGHVTTNTQWNVGGPASIVTPAFDTDGDPSTFSDNEKEEIQRIWQRVSEDFRPFKVDVTTEFVSEDLLIKNSATDPIYGMRAAIGGTFNIIPGLGPAGGVAFIGGFGDATLSPAFVFADTQGDDEQVVTETISHEIGHTLGLSHDGDLINNLPYYPGHGTGATAWGAIMGAAFGIELTQWSDGQYPGADNQEDDLAIISSLTNQNKFGYRNDDYGSSRATAQNFVLTSLGRGQIQGIIERNTDSDWFKVVIPDGVATINATPAVRGANLDIKLDLLDENGVQVVSSNPVGALNASITRTLREGTYYVRIQGTGKGATANDPGYPKYGSLGQYTLNFKVDPSSHIRGTVYLDGDADGARQSVDPPAVGFTVFVDDNLNGRVDANESSVVTDGAGGFDLITVQGTRNVRVQLPVGYFPTDPPSGIKTVVVPGQGGSVTDVLLGISGAKGEVRGRKILDIDGNGVFEPNEGDRFLENVYVFVDLDGDGKAGVGEPAALTDANGNFVIKKVPIGPRTLREVLPPGYGVVAPTTPDGSYSFNMTPGAIITGFDFWNSPAADYGDAPDSYKTLASSNGPVHGYLRGFGLGSLVDADADGNPTTNALGDDGVAFDDEDGVTFTSTASPGKALKFDVTTMVPRFTNPGYLNAWIDLNQDGDFLDSGEKIISARQLAAGTYSFTVNLPATIPVGLTYLRFRYGTETTLGFAGPSLAGEVEDYAVNVLGTGPTANDDFTTVQQFSTDNKIFVLANDVDSVNGQARIVNSSVPATSNHGGALRIGNNGTPNNPYDDFVFYDAAPAYGTDKTYADSFDYTITDGVTQRTATVHITVNKISTPPQPVEDIFAVDAAGTTTIDVLANDTPGTDPGTPLNSVSLYDFQTNVRNEAGAVIGTVSRATNGTPNDLTDDRLIFTPAANSAGQTGQFIYNARNPNVNDPPTSKPAVVTLQVRNDNVADSNDDIQLSIQVRDVLANGGIGPTALNQLVQGQSYWVGIYSDDLRNSFDFQNNPGANANGALSVYLDLLFNRSFVRPDLSSGSLEIRYQGVYNANNTGRSGTAQTGVIDELGVTSGSSTPAGPSNVPVMFVKFNAVAPTPGTAPLVLFKTDPAEERSTVDPANTHDIIVNDEVDTTQIRDVPINNVAYFHAAPMRVIGVAPPSPGTGNVAPTLAVGVDFGYQLNTAAVLLAQNATVRDPDSANFAGGMLKAHISNGAGTGNRLTIGGPFVVSNQEVRLNGKVIGWLSASNAGVGTHDLEISLTANANAANVQSLLRSIRFGTVNATSTATRKIDFTLWDGDGGQSVIASKQVYVRR